MTGRKLRLISACARLGKFSISLPVALTTLTGYLLSHGNFSRGIVFPVAGVFLLASASSALNQVQEHKTDLIMPRTQNRPIPAGIISMLQAWIFILLFATAGLAILFIFNGSLTAILGLLTFFWYNAIYTPLKRRSAFAAVPGGVVGALPPLIGWVAAGGSLNNPAAIALGFFFFIGQIPHFWLLLLRYGHEYELAGLQSLTTRFSDIQIRRLSFIWIAATAVSAIMLPAFYHFNYHAVVYTIWALSVILVITFTRLIFPARENVDFKYSFILINIYYFLMMVVMSMQAIL